MQVIQWETRRVSRSWGAYVGLEIVWGLSDITQGQGAQHWPIVTVDQAGDDKGGHCPWCHLPYHVGVTWDHRSVVPAVAQMQALTLSS